MAVSFNHIPSGSGIKMPLFYAEVDNSQANVFSSNLIALIIAQKLASGTATVNTPFIAASQLQVNTLCGAASQAARMYDLFRTNDPASICWIIPVAEPSSGVMQTGTITFTGTASGAGTINVYIAGQIVSVGVAIGDTPTVIAAALAAAITAATTLPVSATASVGVVTWTCLWKGATGADIQVTDSYGGQAAGESLPAGVSVAYAYVVAGTGAPVLTGAITGMGDDQYDVILHPFNDSTSLAALSTELGDVSGRWSYSRQIYGHAYTAKRDTYGNLVTWGNGLSEDTHQTAFCVDADTQAPLWEIVAAIGGATCGALNADITRPTQTLPLVGITAPRRGNHFVWSQLNGLLGYNVAACYVEGGYLRIARSVTMYNKNALGQTDVSYLDSEDMHKHAYILRYFRSLITSQYGRCGLADDGTPLAPGRAIVTPKIVRGEILSGYRQLEYQGLVENLEAFKANLIVERDSTNPNRLNVLFPPDITNALRVFALLYQFRLQYPVTIQ